LPVSVVLLLMTIGLYKPLEEGSSAVAADPSGVAPDGNSLKGELNA